MAAYPEWQKRVHDEMDQVIGTNRLPEFPADRPHLPILEAVLRESFRCICVVPVLLGHVTTRDDEYRGFYIPKGTSVVANNWSVTLVSCTTQYSLIYLYLRALDHDDEFYPDPLKFDPTRFLTEDNQFHADIALTDTPMFGHGRRSVVFTASHFQCQSNLLSATENAPAATWQNPLSGFQWHI